MTQDQLGRFRKAGGMKLTDRMSIKQAVDAVRNEKSRSLAISTEFGVVDISRKEALRMIETCELDTVVLTLSPGQLILEYPE